MARSLQGRRGDVESPEGALGAGAPTATSPGGSTLSPAARTRGFHWGWSSCRVGVFATPALQTPPLSPSPGLLGADSRDGDDQSSGKNRHRGRHKRRLLYVFCCAFLAVNVLLPLHHWMLYPSKPSWTEEGHFAAWHPRLRAKEGWLYLVGMCCVCVIKPLDPGETCRAAAGRSCCSGADSCIASIMYLRCQYMHLLVMHG